MPILEDVDVSPTISTPGSPPRPHAGHLSDILGDMGALADALDVMTLGSVEADASQSRVTRDEAEAAEGQPTGLVGSPQLYRLSSAGAQTGWWDEILGVFQTHGSRSKAAA